jgi:Dolichyl-phosphate-mannose-protein mannosyltransferase
LIERLRSLSDRTRYSIYALALAVSISTWFITIRAPLWLDETVSVFLIQGGPSTIVTRRFWPDSQVYSFLLWLWTRAVGTGEIALRLSSVLPMLGAVYVLYRVARQLFERDVAFIAAIVFCLHPIIIFAAVDVRPYAFAALAINVSILTLVHLRHNDSNWLAAVFGLSAACIVEFQLLFAAILPALFVCFIAGKVSERRTLWRQLGIALAVFAAGMAAVVPRYLSMVHSSSTHVFAPPPKVLQLVSTITVRGLVIIAVLFILIAAFKRRLRWDNDRWTILLCSSLALVPILILYVVSAGTSTHVFVPRYRLVAVPGTALCWALVITWINWRELRFVFCAVLAIVAACICFTAPSFQRHQYSWRDALALAEKNASPDHAPVLICSDIPEADSMRMPVGPAIKESGILAPLSYYPLSVPVVPLPRSLNGEAKRAGLQFLQQASERHQRFLALAFVESYATLDWLRQQAAATDNVRELGVLDGVKVLEFAPREVRR